MDRINEKVGAWLLVQGHTKQSLASSLGMTPQTLNNRLDGTYDWTFNEVCSLADILGCKLDELRLSFS